jgi:nucleotide-binding universal stress UspA family protein
MSTTEVVPSISVQRILLATDFSTVSEKAALYARALAQRFSSLVELAHVFDPSRVATYEDALLGLPVSERRQTSRDSLEQLRNQFVSSGVETRTVSLEGHHPAPELLRVAKEQQIDLIVAGTTSKQGMERLLLGSTAEQLIRNATCPVLTVGPHTASIGELPLAFQAIIYATDLTPRAAKAALFAVSFAEDSGGRLYLCHVCDSSGESSAQDTLSEKTFESLLRKMIPRSSYDWCSPECIVKHGDVSEAILSLAVRVKADLIVLGARHSSFWLTHVARGLTSELLAQATCPVMTVC